MLGGQPGVLWGHPKMLWGHTEELWGHPGMLGVAVQGAGMSWPQQLASV